MDNQEDKGGFQEQNLQGQPAKFLHRQGAEEGWRVGGLAGWEVMRKPTCPQFNLIIKYNYFFI